MTESECTASVHLFKWTAQNTRSSKQLSIIFIPRVDRLICCLYSETKKTSCISGVFLLFIVKMFKRVQSSNFHYSVFSNQLYKGTLMRLSSHMIYFTLYRSTIRFTNISFFWRSISLKISDTGKSSGGSKESLQFLCTVKWLAVISVLFRIVTTQASTRRVSFCGRPTTWYAKRNEKYDLFFL